MPQTDGPRTARLRADLRSAHPSVDPAKWYPVLDRNPDALDPQPRPGSVWLVDGTRTRQLPASLLEFR